MKLSYINVGLALLITLGTACQSEEVTSQYTGREISYPLIEGAFFDQATSGTLLARERNDQSVDIFVKLSGTASEAIHPVHLHFGSLSDDQPVAAWLNPLEDVGNQQSESVTRLSHLHDDSPMTFDLFEEMDGSVKIHFEESGQWEDVILGATNIGRNYASTDAVTFKNITICNARVAE